MCDPVFLLGRTKWDHLASNSDTNEPYKDDYILLYDCEYSAKLKDIAIALKAKSGCKIVTVSPIKGRYADRDYSLSGPLEFVNLLRNSRYIVANSFHALAFALIFQKPFFIANRTEGINTRMRDFLKFLSLDDRLIDNPTQITLDAIDYKKVNVLLNQLIENSKAFLKTQINS